MTSKSEELGGGHGAESAVEVRRPIVMAETNVVKETILNDLKILLADGKMEGLKIL